MIHMNKANTVQSKKDSHSFNLQLKQRCLRDRWFTFFSFAYLRKTKSKIYIVFKEQRHEIFYFGYFIKQSIMNMNNPTNIRKNSKSFLYTPFVTRTSFLIKKTGDEKSHDPVTLISQPRSQMELV